MTGRDAIHRIGIDNLRKSGSYQCIILSLIAVSLPRGTLGTNLLNTQLLGGQWKDAVTGTIEVQDITGNVILRVEIHPGVKPMWKWK
jgi:hypothetical protein